jgi:hypothetical protein
VTEPTKQARSLLRRGWLVLAVMVALASVTVVAAYVRNTDTNRLNAENRRLNSCVRDLITTVSDRAAYTSQLDEQDDAYRAATDRFWVGIASTSDVGKRRAVFDQYQRDKAAIQARRDAVLRERDAHKFPTLAQCQ